MDHNHPYRQGTYAQYPLDMMILLDSKNGFPTNADRLRLVECTFGSFYCPGTVYQP
jgi:hypothetical protein